MLLTLYRNSINCWMGLLHLHRYALIQTYHLWNSIPPCLFVFLTEFPLFTFFSLSFASFSYCGYSYVSITKSKLQLSHISLKYIYFFYLLFIYLAVLGLSCGMQSLCCGMWDLVP